MPAKVLIVCGGHIDLRMILLNVVGDEEVARAVHRRFRAGLSSWRRWRVRRRRREPLASRHCNVSRDVLIVCGGRL